MNASTEIGQLGILQGRYAGRAPVRDQIRVAGLERLAERDIEPLHGRGSGIEKSRMNAAERDELAAVAEAEVGAAAVVRSPLQNCSSTCRVGTGRNRAAGDHEGDRRPALVRRAWPTAVKRPAAKRE